MDYNYLHLSSATLHEAAGRTEPLPSVIKPLSPDMRVCAPAFTVRCLPGSNLALHHAIYAAEKGAVLVVDVGDGIDFGYWGEVMTVAAQARGLAGLVIHGGVRDKQQICEAGFPVFSAEVSIRGTNKNSHDAALGVPISIGSIVVRPDDLIFGDADGVVVVPKEQVAEIVHLAELREAKEAAYMQRLRAGETSVDIYDLPELAPSIDLVGQNSRRRSVNVPGLQHGRLPIPNASRVGNILATGGIRGVDPATGKLAADAGGQIQQMFDNLRVVVEAAGGKSEDIVKVTIWVADPSLRELLNPVWIAMFPDSDSRPSRHTLNYPMEGASLVQCEALACISTAAIGRPV